MTTPRTDPHSPRIDGPVMDRRAVRPGFLIEVGETVLPLYGNPSVGWSIEERDILESTPYRYTSLDELIFAVLNFFIQVHGNA